MSNPRIAAPVITAIDPASLSADGLRRRLRDLAGDERQVQVDFLLHLAEFDERRGFAEAGYDSLWSFCLRELHLREGPAGRRIHAMRVLKRHPSLDAPLRDGRLCLSTVTLIAPLVGEYALDDLVQRAAYRSKMEVEQLVATLRPMIAPREGIRLVPASRPADIAAPPPQRSFANAAAPTTVGETATEATAAIGAAATCCAANCCAAPAAVTIAANTASDTSTCSIICSATASASAAPGTAPPAGSAPDDRALSGQARPGPTELRPVAADQWSLRVTLDAEMMADLEQLRSLLSHKNGGSIGAVVREALRCAVTVHGKRRGAVAPSRTRAASPKRPLAVTAPKSTPALGDTALPDTAPPETALPPARVHIPIAVRREVWRRDEGCCAWVAPDGRRCGSRRKLEYDHIRPVAVGGESTIANVRLACRTHNVLHAEQTLGRSFMERFRRTERRDHEPVLIPAIAHSE